MCAVVYCKLSCGVCCSVSAAGDSVTSSVITTCMSSTLALQTSSHLPTVSLSTAVTAVASSSSYVSSSHDAVVEQARQVRSQNLLATTYSLCSD